jgi:hypothetical protein
MKLTQGRVQWLILVHDVEPSRSATRMLIRFSLIVRHSTERTKRPVTIYFPSK